ncbi:unnamed protein product [Brugia pahangi]|uniref:Uncharacterized protein n=1 Tax=Brugia pahangi TaxID=6280 RepID=A0A0N4TCS4_BRUPA|nr:unnamed protein product [Brugia pahangi]
MEEKEMEITKKLQNDCTEEIDKKSIKIDKKSTKKIIANQRNSWMEGLENINDNCHLDQEMNPIATVKMDKSYTTKVTPPF